jgi:L-seryl-tRNA(Ser) seleniumtransferase
LDLSAIVEGARQRNVAVLVDGAYALPPRENLWHYTRDLGVDAFITSGGKAIRGPQSTGLVLGKRRVIDGCKFHASPNLRLGRGMKVGKEEFAGIYTAVKLFLADDLDAQASLQRKQIARLADYLKDIGGLKLTVEGGSTLHIDMDAGSISMTAEAAAKLLLEGEPSILLRGKEGRVTVRATLLQAGEEEAVGRRLREVLS